jgi:hypothetical protein
MVIQKDTLKSLQPGYVETGMGPVTDKVINTILSKLSSTKFRNEISNRVFDPIMNDVKQKVIPYLYMGGIMYLIIVFLLVIIIYILVKKRK